MQDYNRGRVIGAVEVIEHIAAGNEDVQAACATIRDAISYEEWEPTHLVDADAEDKSEKTCADTRRDFQELVDRKVSEAEVKKTLDSFQNAVDAEKAACVTEAMAAAKKHHIKLCRLPKALGCKLADVYNASKDRPSKVFAAKLLSVIKLHTKSTEAPA